MGETEGTKLTRSSGARLWLFRVAALVAAPAVFLLVLEGGLRLGGFGRPTPFFVETAEPGTIVTNQFFGHRFFPASIARTPEIERFRRVKPEGTYRIFVVGGSAAMGFPEPAFGVARVLEALLREEYEGLNVEVINVAMTATNSHVALPIARECARYEPDALVIYLGNNEVVGPYGPSSVSGDAGSALPLVRAAIRLRATRTGQMLHQAVAGWGSPDGPPKEWKGMAMFLDNQVPWGDPRLETVYHNFRANLLDISRAGIDAGARVVLSTVAVNLADSAPFAAQHLELEGERLRQWEKAYQAGVAHQANERCTEAVKDFAVANSFDHRNADLAFRLAQCLRAVGRYGEALQHFEWARDLDTLRFRADSRLNAVIRETATQLGEQGLILVDAEKLFDDASTHGLVGAEWFYEHVHLNFAGNYLLARSIAGSLRDDLEQNGARKTGRTATEESIASQIVLTRWDRYRMWRDIAGLMEQPPFPNQLDYGDAKAATAARLADLLGDRTLGEWRVAATEAYESAVARAPENLHLRRRYAELLDAGGSSREAASQWRVLLKSVPGNLYWLTSLGASSREAGAYEEASAAFREVLNADTENAAGHFGLGSVLQKQEEPDEAVEAYEEALRLRPHYPEAENNLGLIAMEQQQSAAALAHFQRAIEMRPSFAQARENLGVMLLKLGRADAAHAEFRRAIEIAQESPSAHYHLGASLAAAGRFGEALPVLDQAVRLDPTSAESRYALGGALAAMGQVEEALRHIEAAIRLKPSFAEALYNRGLLLARQGRLNDAVRAYREAIAARPNYPEAWNNMGTAFARQGKLRDAVQCFEEALRLRPDFDGARRNLEHVRASRSQQ